MKTVLVLFLAAAIAVTGCNKTVDNSPAATAPAPNEPVNDPPDTATTLTYVGIHRITWSNTMYYPCVGDTILTDTVWVVRNTNTIHSIFFDIGIKGWGGSYSTHGNYFHEWIKYDPKMGQQLHFRPMEKLDIIVHFSGDSISVFAESGDPCHEPESQEDTIRVRRLWR